MATASVSPMRRRYLILLVVGLALAMAGCGGDEETPTAAEDKAAAKEMVLTEADVPGLTQDEDGEGDGSSSPSDEAFEECVDGNQVLVRMGIDDPRGTEVSFSNEEGSVSVYSAVSLAETEKDATAAFTALERSSFAGCFEGVLQTTLQEEFGDDGEVLDVTVSELPDDDQGDESVGFRAAIELGAAGQTVTLSMDFAFVRVDRALGTLAGFDFEDDFADDERARLLGIMADRMADA